MTWRAGAVAAARAAHAAFFLSVAAYCFLSYSPFAYGQFIKPSVVPALTDFVAVSPWLYWAVVLLTILTLMPSLRDGRDGRGRRGWIGAWLYVAVTVPCGVVVLLHPPLATIGNTVRGLVVGLLALVPPIGIAIADHRVWPAPDIIPADRSRVFAACALSAPVAWLIYAAAVPVRLTQTVGIELAPREFAVAMGASLVFDCAVFAILFLVALASSLVARRLHGRASVDYWVAVALLGAAVTVVVYALVCASIAFTGRDAWIASGTLGFTVAAVWADIALLRVNGIQRCDALAVFSAPVAGRGARGTCLVMLAALPLVAGLMVSGVAQLDWNFLLQKLSVLVVWTMAFALLYAALGEPRRVASPRLIGVALLAVFASSAAVGRVEQREGPRVAMDRYAALDPSFRLIRDARTTRSAETAEYYAYLRANTLWVPRSVTPPVIDFVPSLRAGAGRPPHIFLFIVDSLRRDYLSPYNPAVTFTPAIGTLAADSFVFERAFTRYAGTGLAIPSIWAGGMVGHMLDQPSFASRNTLLKLLDANGYVRMMGMDHIVEELVPRDAHLEELDVGKGTMDVDLCGTVDEVGTRLDARRDTPPVFVYTLPQNVHIAVAARRLVPAGEAYPGFFDRVASSVHHVDTCIGRFVERLKRSGLYDDSIIILTSDHGDSLGEEGRWGHAYFIYPEVMRIPLIVHLPPSLKTRFRADVDAAASSTDITPSLYALLGAEPDDLGPLFGRPLFADMNGEASRSPREPFLLASSYGAVYATVTGNGRRMYVVDAVDGRDYAFDMSGSRAGTRLDVTPSMTVASRASIRAQLDRLAALYHVNVEP